MYGRDNELKYTNTFIIEHGTYYKNFRILDSGMVLFDGYLNENQNNTGFIGNQFLQMGRLLVVKS